MHLSDIELPKRLIDRVNLSSSGRSYCFREKQF